MFKFEDESNTEQQSVQVTKIVDLSEQSLDKRSLLKWGIPAIILTGFTILGFLAEDIARDLTDRVGLEFNLVVMLAAVGAAIADIKIISLVFAARSSAEQSLELAGNFIEIRDESESRKLVWRKFMVFLPLSFICIALISWLLAELPQTIIGLIIVGVFSIAIVIELVSAARDIRSSPIVTQGRASRLWQKSRMMIFGQVNYLLIDRRLFEVNLHAYQFLNANPDRPIRIRHWPHSNLVISIEYLEAFPENN